MKRITATLALATVLCAGPIATAKAENPNPFHVYVKNIWEHKVIVIAELEHDKLGGIRITDPWDWEFREAIERELDGRADFACKLYDRIAVALNELLLTEQVTRHTERIEGYEALYACATEDPN